MSQTFKYSGTKIITPMKVYDPENEFDEEYFEFGLFMSRREYKTINRRLQRGRISSAKEGKFVGKTAKVKNALLTVYLPLNVYSQVRKNKFLLTEFILRWFQKKLF